MKHSRITTRSAVAVAWLAALLATCMPASPALAAEGSCANEARRVEQASTYLPDCRAYELIAPTGYESAEPEVVNYGPGRVLISARGMYASISGDRLAWTSEYPSPQSTGLDYLSTRAANGWTTEDVIPPQQVANGLLCPRQVQMAAYSVELTAGVLADGYGQPGSGEGEGSDCGHDEPLLVPGEPIGFQNLFLRDNESATYQLVDVTPPGTPAPEPPVNYNKQYFPAAFQAGSADLSHVVFEEELPIAEGAGSGDELYDYFDGAVHLITYLPGGIPVHGVLAGSTPNVGVNERTDEYQPHNLADYRHAMSADGSRVFFEAEGGLYARTNPEQAAAEECSSPSKACSVQIDQAQAGAEGPSGGGKFALASEDGSRVFFTDANHLTVGSHAESGKPDLYEYDFEKPEGERVTDLTVDASEPADVLGVSGASEDGSDLYFVAQANLTGAQQNSYGATALAPAQGMGEVKGGGEGTGEFTGGSDRVTNVKVTSGEFFVGQEVGSEGALTSGTVIACSPNCTTPAELTLSTEAKGIKVAKGESTSLSFIGYGHSQVAGVSTSLGAFKAGMAISGAGIRPHTWITAVGNGTLALSQGVEVAASGAQTLFATAANLYLRGGGTTTFIASLNAEGGDRCDWTMACGDNGSEFGGLTARTSGNGAFIAFDSDLSLTGYENEGPACVPLHENGNVAAAPEVVASYKPGRCEEIYRYSVSGSKLECASCDPGGAPPYLPAVIRYPTQASLFSNMNNSHPERNVSDSGQVFFESADPLVPSAIDGHYNVYEYEGGKPYLVSSGTSDADSYFLEASPDGSNVFFATPQELVKSAVGAAYGIYDARIGGGFRVQSESVAPPACLSLEGCHSPLSEPPAEFSVASATLAGSGNLEVKQLEAKTEKPRKKGVKHKGDAKLRRALERCARRYRQRRHKRNACEQRIRKRFPRESRASEHHGGAK